MRFVKTLELGIMLAAAACGLHAQAKPASGTGSNSAPPATSQAAPQSAKPADKAAAKPATQAPAKSGASAGPTKPVASAKSAAPKPAAAKKAAKKAGPKPTKPATSARSTPTAEREPRVAKRDPFESLVGGGHGGGPKEALPPGKAGLQVSTLRLDGIVRAPNGMIAVVSNPQARTYFLREGDQLYDGRVEKIAMDGVSFHEIGKDAFGKPVERQVNKRIYASAGEQQ
jgi:hypothetical protein